MHNVDKENSEFWNDMCGSNLASQLGIIDDSHSSLKRYDAYYLSYYPYLLKHVPVNTFKNKQVLEIGLGYGTLSQEIAESGALYTGLDIANGPVKMVNKRLAHLGLSGTAVVGSIKDCPFGDETFDVVAAIGCFHHTGDLNKAIEESYRILKKGGKCFLMVYNKYSFRQWIHSPFLTLNRFLSENFHFKNLNTSASLNERKSFDINLEGTGAPETQFYSKSNLLQIMKDAGFHSISLQTENMDSISLFGITLLTREQLLNNLGKSFGLDTYFSGTK